MKAPVAGLAFAAFLGAAASAQEPPAPPADPGAAAAELGENIPPDEWRRLTAGRTVWYLLGDDLWGRESYRTDRDEVVFQFPDGICLEAVWSWSDSWYCFDFGEAAGLDGPHCFRHVRHDGEFWAIARRGPPQRIERIDRAPISCGPAVSS